MHGRSHTGRRLLCWRKRGKCCFRLAIVFLLHWIWNLTKEFQSLSYKDRTIILCLDRVPISQETRTLLEILYNQCPQHPFQRWRFVSFLNISHLTLFLSFSHSMALLTSFLTVFSAFLQTLPLCFIHVWEHTCVHKCVCVCKRYVYVLRAT